MKKLLLTDLDDTLLGDEEGTLALGNWLAGRPEVVLGYATGRDFGKVLPILARYPALRPAAVICDVGTEVRFAPGWEVDPEYERRMRSEFDPETARRRLGGLPGIVPQKLPPRSLRVSYYLRRRTPPDAELLQAVLEELQPFYAVRFSLGHALDLLPRNGGKGEAARFLAARLGFPPDRVLVAGDSGNDLDLLESGFRAVLVGNASPEMRDRPLSGVYRARGRSAWGILEALDVCGW